MVVACSGDQVFADVETHIEARKEPEVFLLGVQATIDSGELGEAHGVGRDRRAGARAGEENDVPGGVALEITCGVRERALALHVGLLGAEADHPFQPPLEKGGVGANVGG